MMIKIAKGRYDLWPGFALQLEETLSFEQGKLYHLEGANGSGKSSFINRILISALQKEKAYILHFEQQASLQLQAVKGWTAIFKPEIRIKTLEQMQDWLIEDLIQNLQKQPLPLWIVADEVQQVSRFRELGLPGSLIFCAHHQDFEDSIKLHFQQISASLSEVHYA